MLFNSYIFILLFLPISILGYYLFNKFEKKRMADVFLIVMSLWFYGYYNPSYLLVICTSIVVNYGISRILSGRNDSIVYRFLLTLGVLGNIIVIFYFKYYDFFIRNVNKAFGMSFELKHILLPLGISFFTFQQISYLVDSFRGETKDYGFIEYALFVCFFPQLIAGPIVLHNETIPQFRDVSKRKINFESLSHGLYCFAIGLFKKVLIADTFSRAVTWGFGDANAALTSMETLIVSLCYTFQIYFDFSGYCDMAIGIGKMFNIEIPQNFNSPYKANSILDFWNRWHMSLTRFLRQYVYYPLGGSKKGTVRTYINVMIVFLVSGIWHGANGTFIVWGVLHGICNCLNRIMKKSWEKMNYVFQWGITFFIVNILWVFFRADYIGQAVQMIKNMLSLTDLSYTTELINCFRIPEIEFLEKYNIVQETLSKLPGLWMWGFIGMAFWIVLNCKNVQEREFSGNWIQSVSVVLMMTWSIMSLSGVSEFLYFGF